MSRRLLYSVLAVGLVLLLAGCGGEQNPAQFRGNPEPNLIDGMYDGFTIVIGLAGAFADDQKYGVYDATGTGRYYDLGYFLGLCIFFATLGGGFALRDDFVSPVGMAALVIAVILILLLLRQ